MAKRRAFWLVLGALLLALPLVLAACGEDSTSVPIGGPAFTGNVTEGIVSEPDSLLPEGSTETVAAQVQAALWAPLFYGDNTGAIQPGLALAVPTTENGGVTKNGLTYKIDLRPDLHWSDGTALTSADVAFTLILMQNPAYGAKTNPAAFQEISSIATPDASTVTITLKAPDAAFLARALTDAINFAPLPRSVYGDVLPARILTSPAYATPSVVSGPFKISARTPGQQITLTKNPNFYLDPQPYLAGMTFKVLGSQSAILKALQSGAIDVAASLDVGSLSQYQAISNYSTAAAQMPNSYEAIYFNETNPMLADISVRQAITQAINPQAMIKTIWSGLATPTCDEQVGTFAHNPKLANCYTYSVAQAQATLAHAGWQVGKDGYLHRNGKTLALRYATVADDAQRVAVAQQIALDLKAVGIKLTVTTYPAQQYATKVLHGYSAYDIADEANTLGYDPDNAAQWACNALTTNAASGGANISHYCNTQVDAALAQEQSSLDQTTRLAAFTTIQHALLNDLPVMYLYAYPNITCATVRLQGYAPSGFGPTDTWNVWDWHLV